MGKKTSVYLSDELAERVRASGVPLPELIKRGLGAGEPEPLEAIIPRLMDEWAARNLIHVAARDGTAAGCPHPKARINKGLCGACGTNVGTAR